MPPFCFRVQVLTAFAAAEKKQKPDWREMFTEVYDEIPKDLRYKLRCRNIISPKKSPSYLDLVILYVSQSILPVTLSNEQRQHIIAKV